MFKDLALVCSTVHLLTQYSMPLGTDEIKKVILMLLLRICLVLWLITRG